MHILHIYDASNSQAAHYVAMLMAQTTGQATMSVATTADDFRRQQEEQQPDIVHLHGKQPFALPKGLRLVVTPHGEPLTAQAAYVVVGRSKMESDELRQQCQRTETVLNPIITRTTTPESCAQQMMSIYERVMNSSVIQLLTATTRHALAVLLCAAIGGDRRWVSQTDAESVSKVGSQQFHLLYTHAEREGVLPLVRQGIGIIGVDAPPYAPIAGYLPDGYCQPEPFKRGQPSHITGDDIPAILADIKGHGLSLLRLTELNRALRHDTLDEEQLVNRLTDQHLLPFFQALLQVLAEQTLLTEGFMPCTPADNRDTLQLRQQLEQRGCITVFS